jgi:centractin
LTIGSERAMFPETLFTQNSSLEGFTGLQNMTTEAISRTDIDIRRDLFASVIIAGGNCMLKNMEKRLERQVTDIAP